MRVGIFRAGWFLRRRCLQRAGTLFLWVLVSTGVPEETFFIIKFRWIFQFRATSITRESPLMAEKYMARHDLTHGRYYDSLKAPEYLKRHGNYCHLVLLGVLLIPSVFSAAPVSPAKKPRWARKTRASLEEDHVEKGT